MNRLVRGAILDRPAGVRLRSRRQSTRPADHPRPPGSTRRRYATAEQLYSQSLLATEDSALKHMELFPLAQRWTRRGATRKPLCGCARRTPRSSNTCGARAPALSQRRAAHGDHPGRLRPKRRGRLGRRCAPGIEDSPIFIVAFPRSGTTLLGMVLDAHPALQSMDEQPFIQDALDEIRAHSGDYPRGLAAFSRGALADLRAAIGAGVFEQNRIESGARLVDKNPLNILRLPVIRRLFPRSPILLGCAIPAMSYSAATCSTFRAPEFALLCIPAEHRASSRLTVDFWFRQARYCSRTHWRFAMKSLVANFEPRSAPSCSSWSYRGTSGC